MQDYWRISLETTYRPHHRSYYFLLAVRSSCKFCARMYKRNSHEATLPHAKRSLARPLKDPVLVRLGGLRKHTKIAQDALKVSGSEIHFFLSFFSFSLSFKMLKLDAEDERRCWVKNGANQAMEPRIAPCAALSRRARSARSLDLHASHRASCRLHWECSAPGTECG